MKRVTRVEQNRRDRHKKLLKAKSRSRKGGGTLKRNRQVQSHAHLDKFDFCGCYMLNYVWFDGCSLPDIIQEIAKEDEERHRRHQRRIVAKQERLKTLD